MRETTLAETHVAATKAHAEAEATEDADAPTPEASGLPGSRLLTGATLRFGALALLVMGLGAVMLWRGPDRESLIAAARGHEFFAPAAAVFGSAVLTAALVPRTLLSLVGGVLFGWLSGSGYVLVGVTLGAVLAFGMGRLLGREFVGRYLRGRLAQIEKAVIGRGVLAVVITRVIPIVPFCVSNYVFGTTGMRLIPFVLGTVVGATPATFAYAALGSATAHGNSTGITAATAMVVALGIGGVIGTYLVWRRRPRRSPVGGG